jgi:hypothetical protein
MPHGYVARSRVEMSIFSLRISMHCMTCSLTACDLISDYRAAFSIVLIGNQIPAEYLLFPAALFVLGHEYRSSNSVRQPFRWLNRRCRRWCSHRYAARIAVAVGAFLAGMGLGGGQSGLAADACLCGEGSARPAQVGEHSADAPVGVGARC